MKRVTHIKRWLVWLSRMHHSRGMGIQSPTDYAFVRYVVNEHWPYYAYQEMDDNGDWLRGKLGRLYFRLANWRQPSMMPTDRYRPYWQAGCHRIQFTDSVRQIQLARVDIEEHERISELLPSCNRHSVLVVEGIWRDMAYWRQLTCNSLVGTTFDLYYCGIIWFDKQRFNHHYIINF